MHGQGRHRVDTQVAGMNQVANHAPHVAGRETIERINDLGDPHPVKAPGYFEDPFAEIEPMFEARSELYARQHPEP